MAQTSHDLDKAGVTDTGINLRSIDPQVNWHRYPLPITTTMLARANVNAGKPRYTSMTDWAGGVRGDDIDVATATVALADSDGDVNAADYTPRTQAAKAAMIGTTLAPDIGQPRGSIAPRDPYPVSTSPAVVAPVVSSISPTTGAAATLPLTVTITGTGFTAWSTVYTGGATTPDSSATYISPTQMKVAIWKATPGTVSVAVEDHNMLSNVDKLFTVT